MATKKPARRMAVSKPSETLMGNQDTLHKGDGMRGEKVLVTFRAPVDLKEALEAFAAERGMNQTTVILEGIRMRLGLDI